jgi:sugar lactone lactonase YvrE
MSIHRPALLSKLALTTLLAGFGTPLFAQSLEDLPVGTIQNFGPNLQTTANGLCRQPEGLAIDPEGNLYAASNSDSAVTVSYVCVIDRKGSLVDMIPIPAGPGASAVALLGELWEGGFLYVLDEADDIQPHGRVIKVNPRTHAIVSVVSGFAFPNGMAEDRHGNIYVTDSFLGTISRFTDKDPTPKVWFTDPLLFSTNPDQPVGANDLAFDADEHFLYMSNAGNRRIVRIPVDGAGNPGPIEIFADGATLDTQLGLPSPTTLYYADGIQFDVAGNLYAMANRAEEIDVFGPDGHLLHRYSGTGQNILDFNASPVFKGRLMFITNTSATDGGVNSKLSVFVAPYPGLPLH